MSQPQVIFWPDAAFNRATIAPLQEVGADLTVKINSNLPNMPNVPVNNSGVYVYDNMLRTVAITSANDVSAVNFFITGLSSPIDGDGNPTLSVVELFTETIAGPNADTVETVRIYQRIDSITTSVAIAPDQISVGFGIRGITKYIFLNLNNSAPLWAGYQGQPINATANFDYQFFASMTKPETIDTVSGKITPFPASIPAFPVFPALQHDTNSVASSINTQVSMPVIVWASIHDREVLPGPLASFYFTVVQQGLNS